MSSAGDFRATADGRPASRFLALTLLAAGAGLLAVACRGETLPLQGEGASAGASTPAGARGDGAGGASGGKHSAGGNDARTAGGSAGSNQAGTGDPPSSVGVNLEGAPIYTRLQRLTNSQWENSVNDILRFETRPNLSSGLVPARPGTDFTNNEKVLFVDPLAFPNFEAAAEAAASIATESSEALARVYGDDVDLNPEGFVRMLGRRAFRRPLTAEEETRYQAVFSLGETLYGFGFPQGVALVIRAMLQSPHFLYRTELGPGGEALSGYEIASKLSFWLLDTTPSDDLLDAAAAGDLDSVDGIESAARAMLETDAAVEVMRDFHAQLYRLAELTFVARPDVPEYSPELKAELELAAHGFFDQVFVQGEGLREIFTSSRAFVGPLLAPLYGMDPAPADLEMRTLASSRVGYFTQVPFLLMHARGRQPSPVGRGAALAMDALCRKLESPPPDLVFPTAEPGQTLREYFEAATAGCGPNCHESFDPLGFAFENFDGMGQERDLDNGEPVNTAASYTFADGTFSFSDAKELMQIMADGPQAHTCYAKKLSGYALQRDIVEADRPLLETLASVSREESLKAMAIALVRDPAFRLRKGNAP
jgi:hypothetical protein